MAAGALWNEVNDGGSLLLCASHLSSSGSCQKSAPPFPAMHHLTSVTTVLWSPAASGVVSASRSVKKQNRNCVVRTVQNSLLQPFFNNSCRQQQAAISPAASQRHVSDSTLRRSYALSPLAFYRFDTLFVPICAFAIFMALFLE